MMESTEANAKAVSGTKQSIKKDSCALPSSSWLLGSDACGIGCCLT